jgi:hypothetical protein
MLHRRREVLQSADPNLRGRRLPLQARPHRSVRQALLPPAATQVLQRAEQALRAHRQGLLAPKLNW